MEYQLHSSDSLRSVFWLCYLVEGYIKWTLLVQAQSRLAMPTSMLKSPTRITLSVQRTKLHNNYTNSVYGPGGCHTITDTIACIAFQVWWEKLRTRLLNELWSSLGVGLIERLELKMAVTPPPLVLTGVWVLICIRGVDSFRLTYSCWRSHVSSKTKDKTNHCDHTCSRDVDFH